MFFTILILIIYLSTASGSLFNLIRTKENNLLVPINIFIGFFLLFLAPFIDFLSYNFNFNSLHTVLIVIILRTFSILFLLNGVMSLKVSMQNEEKRQLYFKIASLGFVMYSITVIILLSFFMSLTNVEYTRFPIVFINNNELNLLIAIIDSLTMAIIVLLLPSMKGFYEPIGVRIGSSSYLIASTLLYFYSTNMNPTLLFLSKIFYVLNPTINSISTISLYYKKMKLEEKSNRPHTTYFLK